MHEKKTAGHTTNRASSAESSSAESSRAESSRAGVSGSPASGSPDTNADVNDASNDSVEIRHQPKHAAAARRRDGCGSGRLGGPGWLGRATVGGDESDADRGATRMTRAMTQPMAPGVPRVFAVAGMSCGGCTSAVCAAVLGLAGTESVQVSLDSNSVSGEVWVGVLGAFV